LRIDNIDVDSAIASVKNLLEKERDLSPSLKAALEVLLVLVALLLNRTTLNSINSSKPPSTDPMARTKIFGRACSYLSACREQGMSATEALALLFQGKIPAFMDIDETLFLISMIVADVS